MPDTASTGGSSGTTGARRNPPPPPTAGARALAQESRLPAGLRREFVPLVTADGAPLDAVLVEPEARASTALVLMHPAISFLQHYALAPLARRGLAVLAVNSRYAGNDTFLLMEKLPLDLAAAVTELRDRYRHVVLLGNSGGGSLAAYYQAQPERPKADGLILLNAHGGRAEVLTAWLDAAVVDERDWLRTDPELDIFEAGNGPPFSAEFVARYREAQRARNRRISAWARARLVELAAAGVRDEVFLVHRTTADPRFLDLSLDPSDRAPGMYYGPDVRAANYAAQGLGRTASLRSWLSQWSLDDTPALAAPALERVACPVLFVQGTADQGIFPGDVRALFDATAARDRTLRWIEGGSHYFVGQPEHRAAALGAIVEWLAERGLA